MSANFNFNANVDAGGNWEDHHDSEANMGYGADVNANIGYGASGSVGMDMGYGADVNANMGYGASGGIGMDMGYGASGSVGMDMGYGAGGSVGVNAGCGGKANVQINSGGCGGVGVGVGCGGTAKVQINSGGGCGGVGVNSMGGGAKVNVGFNTNTNFNAGGSGGVYIEQHPAPVTLVTPGKTVFSISGNNHSTSVHSAALDPFEKNALASQTECGVMINIIDPSQAVIVLILNIVFPGIGTMVYGCMGRASSRCCCWFLLGLCQDFLGFICIGWIWGIIFALKVMAASALYDEIDLYQPLEPVAVVQMGTGLDGQANLTVKVST